jgi:hypothetical protein
MGRYIDRLRKQRRRKQAWFQKSLREPAMAGTAPARTPAVSHEHRTLAIYGPVPNGYDRVSSRWLGHLAEFGMYDRMRCRLVERTRQLHKQDHWSAYIQFGDDSVE